MLRLFFSIFGEFQMPPIDLEYELKRVDSFTMDVSTLETMPRKTGEKKRKLRVMCFRCLCVFVMLSFHLTLLILRLCRWTMALELNFHLLFPKSKHSHKGIPDLCCSLNYRAAKAHTIESDQASLWPAVTQLSEQDCSPGGTLLVLLLSHPLTCVLTAGLTFHFLFLRAFSYRKCDKWIWIHFFFFSTIYFCHIFHMSNESAVCKIREGCRAAETGKTREIKC